LDWCFRPIRSVQIPSTPGEQKRRFTWFKTARRLVITDSIWRTEFGLIPVHIAITSQMSEALSKEKNIYYSTLQNMSLISKFPILSKARIYFANYSRLSFPFDGQRNSRAFFEFQPPEPSNILFYSMPLSKRASSLIFFPFWSYTYSKQSTSASFPRGLSYSKIRSHREAPVSSFKSRHLRASPFRAARPFLLWSSRPTLFTVPTEHRKSLPIANIRSMILFLFVCCFCLSFFSFDWRTSKQRTARACAKSERRPLSPFHHDPHFHSTRRATPLAFIWESIVQFSSVQSRLEWRAEAPS